MFSYKTLTITLDKITFWQNKLGALLNSCSAIAIDSRKVSPGSIFCAYPGVSVDGRDYIKHAIDAKAQAVLWEPGKELDITIKNYPITDLMQYVGIFAAIKAKHPSKRSLNLAVTGTNGKTSISHWLNQAYFYLGKKTAIIGTTGAGIYPKMIDYASTTPDPITLQHLLSEFKADGVDVLAMEVSSHALEQGRVNGVNFTSAIFTNLTQDHLDYHKTMEDYYLAKEKLFYWDSLQNAIINSDDDYGIRLINNLKRDISSLPIISYGISSGDLQASQIMINSQGLSFNLNYQGRMQLIKANIIGRFNVYNLLAVCATLLVNGVNWKLLPEVATSLTPVAGRMDTQIIPNCPLVIVDYSHTPDSLAKALATLVEIKAEGNLICVFGCGGNRDKAKRPLMGAAAARFADKIIVTTDNPRFEEADAIIKDILPGLAGSNHQVILDRLSAIKIAIKYAQPNDIVLIAGKGHEDYQEIKGVKYQFSDLQIVAELLNETAPI